MILHEGNIAEMVTGEGKTLVATLPAYLNAIGRQRRPHRHGERLPCARRDMEWMAPIYTGLGLTIDAYLFKAAWSLTIGNGVLCL